MFTYWYLPHLPHLRVHHFLQPRLAPRPGLLSVLRVHPVEGLVCVLVSVCVFVCVCVCVCEQVNHSEFNEDADDLTQGELSAQCVCNL